MRVAISVADERISPVFDVARRLLLVDVENGREIARTTEALEETGLPLRAKRVAELGANVLICGAVSQPLEMMLISAGIEVVPHICGDAQQILQAFVLGNPLEEVFAMPGCCGRRRRFRGGQSYH